jgi:hypothetical protein
LAKRDIMKILFENGIIRISINNKYHCLEYLWKSNTKSDKLKELMNKICYFANLYNCYILIPDLDNISSNNREIKYWTESVWFPDLIKNGITTFLIINPHSGMIMNSINNSEDFILNLGNNTTIRTFYFENIIEAREWLIINQQR